MKWERAALVLALVGGGLLRIPCLDLRPMHTDEAVHAVKFGALLENGTYRYDRHEYHGPTLNYFTLLPAWLTGEKTLAGVTERTLRIVPVFFGLCLILLVFILPDIGPRASACAALLSAFSPAMAFYSRYYIQETLLVCFAFGLIVAAWRLGSSGRRGWSVMAGVCAGLMIATKETWIISVAMMGLAVLGVLIIQRQEKRPRHSPGVKSIGIALLCTGVVWVLFFSSFLTHWEGLRDSVLAYGTYFTRAGENARHGHPWYYFLEMLTGTRGDHGPLWTEAGIVLFGIGGVWSTLREKPGTAPQGRDIRIFLGLYALLMLIVSSIIPYKTPWLVLGALQPLIIMAGVGMSALFGWLEVRRPRPLGIIIAGLTISHLAWQAWMANFRYYDDPVNPYVYSHPGDDVREIVAAVTRSVQGGALPLQVVSSGDDYWPLPWYLRALPRVGWWNDVGEAFVPTGVILASPEFEPALLKKMYETPPPGERKLYVPLFDRPMFLRPGKELRGYIALDLLNAMQTGKPQ
ncbi:MAG TPA: flippase activity-associated protein Agl23 [Bacteroidota bacterium]